MEKIYKRKLRIDENEKVPDKALSPLKQVLKKGVAPLILISTWFPEASKSCNLLWFWSRSKGTLRSGDPPFWFSLPIARKDQLKKERNIWKLKLDGERKLLVSVIPTQRQDCIRRATKTFIVNGALHQQELKVFFHLHCMGATLKG